MLIKACISCSFHQIRAEDDQRSYCKKEFCWAEYSDCMTIMALKYFLKDQRVSVNVSDRETHPSQR